MKKIIALVSLVTFFASVSIGQQPTPAAKNVTSIEAKADTKDAKSMPACCQKANASCCKNNKEAKACTPEQKASCAKAGMSEKGASGCNHK